MAHVIKITGSDTATGRLVLSDQGHTEASHGSNVIWQIHDDKVLSIRIVPKGSTDNVWSREPRRQGNPPNSHWQGTTRFVVTRYLEYAYSIEWTSSSGQHTHDPIISMRPSGFDDRLKYVVIAGVAAVAAILPFKFLSRKNRKW